MAQLGRAQPFKPHLPSRLVAPSGGYPRPPAIVVSQAIQRSAAQGHAAIRDRGRCAHATGVIVAPGGPTPIPRVQIVLLDQAVQRSIRRPPPPKPHVSGAVVSLLSPVPPGEYDYQALKRPYIGRRGPRPLTLPKLGSPQPVQAGVFKFQALRRVFTGRTIPKPHLATSIVTPQITFIAPPAVIVDQDQALRRALIGRTPPKPHLVGPNLAARPFPPAIIKSQALARPQIGRRGQRPITVPHLGGAVPVSPGTFTFQALKRALYPRPAPHSHLAPANLTPPFLAAPAKVIGQSIWRAVRRWSPFRPHISTPNLIPAPVVLPGRVTISISATPQVTLVITRVQ